MIRFFRHIRKKLMEQNKTRTYILYAIGEILLVLLGNNCPYGTGIVIETL